MKKKNIPVEFVFQLFALIIAIIIVHAFYVSVVRPNAAQIIEEQNIAAAADPDYVRERRVSVLIKDMEQEACFILGIWALAIMGYKTVTIFGERRLLDVDLVPVAEGMRILPEDTREFARQIEALPEESQRMLLPRALLNALRRFSTTRNIQDVSSSTRNIYETEGERLESELSMIRYISWAIPSIGFIGTVRGIQLDVYCTAHQYLPDVSRPPVAIAAGTACLRRRKLLRRQVDQAYEGRLAKGRIRTWVSWQHTSTMPVFR